MAPFFGYALTYGLPFIAYFLGILVRYHARFLRASEPPPLREQLIAGCVFSFVAVAPLLPSLRLAVSADGGVDVIAYFLVIVVIMQEGLVLHERAVTAVKKLVRHADDSSASAPPSTER